jgi:hypothetical protein
MSEERKSLGLCVLAFLLGVLIVVSMGCAAGAVVRVNGHGAGVGVGVGLDR